MKEKFKISSSNPKNWETGYIIGITNKDFKCEIRPKKGLYLTATYSLNQFNTSQRKFIQLGQLVQYHIFSGKLRWVKFKPLTEEQIKSSQNWANLMIKKINWK